MNIDDAAGPGVDTWLIDRLKAWGIRQLTDIQVRALRGGIADGHSLIVSAPTSSGKTLVGEIALLSALRSGRRAIYLVSHKALADQKFEDFTTRFGERAPEAIASVGLNTGDRAEGDVNAQLLIATYEKALGLVVTGQLDPTNALIVADELQILGEDGRGPDIESLCAAFRRRGYGQIVALTATVQNAEDLAGWMNCDTVSSTIRDVPLYQEIWYAGRVYQTVFGHEEGEETPSAEPAPADVPAVVRRLLDLRRGPVLVFTESRREASNYATQFAQNCPRISEGIAVSEQLDFFTEPTEASDQLRAVAERGVVFHTADLSPQERQVVEDSFTASRFDVCFATSTLAAGVNFPFRSVVFPKLTFQWGERAGTQIRRSDYRNMSGRAGRLGMHDDGYAILLPRNEVELAHANVLVRPENDRIASRLVNLSLRKSILMLVASRLAASVDEVMDFFRNTLYWYQILDRNPPLLEKLEIDSQAAIEWLAESELIVDSNGALLITPLGQATAQSGLLPATAVGLGSMLKRISAQLTQSFVDWIPGLIYAVCASDEFRGERPSRFLPYIPASYDSVTFWTGKTLPVALDRTDIKLAQCAHAIMLYVEGLAERKIAFATKVTAGAISRVALDVAWVLDGLHKLSTVHDLGCPQTVSNQIAMLARRVRWGAPAEALDVMRVAERHRVPGFGRQRAMALVTQGIVTLQDVLDAPEDRLTQLMRNDRRAQALRGAASSTIGYGPNRFTATHERVAAELGMETLVVDCNRALGVDYEDAIVKLLSEESNWIVKALDDGIRQNVPDILIELGDRKLLIECKTCTKAPPMINKEEAWAVLQKSADFDRGMRRVTLGKPRFDETSIKKAAANSDITLVEHHVFLEALLRVHAGTLTPDSFMEWLSEPGVADLDRLGGKATFATA